MVLCYNPLRGHDLCNDIYVQVVSQIVLQHHIAAASTCISAVQYMRFSFTVESPFSHLASEISLQYMTETMFIFLARFWEP